MAVTEWKEYKDCLAASDEEDWDIDYGRFGGWIGNPFWVMDRFGDHIGMVRQYKTAKGGWKRWAAHHPEDGSTVFLFGPERACFHSKSAAIAYLCYDRLIGDDD